MIEEKKWDEHSSTSTAGGGKGAVLFLRKDENFRSKERDGFSRRVSDYDGNLIKIEGLPTYEIGNYLGGGVAGVVYQGHRLRPLSEYPIRHLGANEQQAQAQQRPDTIINELSTATIATEAEQTNTKSGFFCGPVHFDTDRPCGGGELDAVPTSSFPQQTTTTTGGVGEDGGNNDIAGPSHEPTVNTTTAMEEKKAVLPSSPTAYMESTDVAIEATMATNPKAPVVMLDAQDAPSRSHHFSTAAGVAIVPQSQFPNPFRSSTAAAAKARASMTKDLAHGLTDEAVAVKILNPVAYRLQKAEALKNAVVVKRGAPMDADVRKGIKPMTEQHVWWVVNPNSRNLRTLQRYNQKEKFSLSSTKNSKGNVNAVQVDRGTEEQGLRLSLIAAYLDPRSNSSQLQELPLTRCIEIWGHVPFNASDVAFEDFMIAIERVNAGHPPTSRNWKSLFTEPHDDDDDDDDEDEDDNMVNGRGTHTGGNNNNNDGPLSEGMTLPNSGT